jgi:hypothetical protein
MTRRLPKPWPLDHPEIIAIALDLMLDPTRRVHYSSVVLALADAAIERIRRELAESETPQPDGDNPPTPPPAPS